MDPAWGEGRGCREGLFDSKALALKHGQYSL